MSSGPTPGFSLIAPLASHAGTPPCTAQSPDSRTTTSFRRVVHFIGNRRKMLIAGAAKSKNICYGSRANQVDAVHRACPMPYERRRCFFVIFFVKKSLHDQDFWMCREYLVKNLSCVAEKFFPDTRFNCSNNQLCVMDTLQRQLRFFRRFLDLHNLLWTPMI